MDVHVNGIKVHFILNFYVVFQCVHDPVDFVKYWYFWLNKDLLF